MVPNNPRTRVMKFPHIPNNTFEQRQPADNHDKGRCEMGTSLWQSPLRSWCLTTR
jgi:hypothetical protein